MAQHYKNESITKSRVKVFLGWEHFNPKGNVAPGRMDQNLCGRLWTENNYSAITLSVAAIEKSLSNPGREYLESLKFEPSKVGDKFGPTFANHVFRLDIVVPDSFENRPVHLLWDSNSEALVLDDNGVPQQGLVGGNHWARRADYPLFPDRKDSVARKGDTLRLYVEIACNGLFGAGRGGDIEPPDMDKYYTLEECCLAVFDPSAWALIHDVTLLSSLVDHLPDNPRRAEAMHVANAAVNAVDVADPTTYDAGRKIAASFLGARNGSSQSTVHTMIHSHIDLAWLWPMASTPAKGGRTFATHLRLMEMYPDCIYVQSQAQLYEWVKEKYPNMWDQICQRVREGRIVPIGATWVEMDCNIPCGESLVRQFVVGQDFFQSNFGMRCNEFWLPDTFGYSGQLPQIMKGCGVDNFLTQKLSWNLFNKFPHSTFIWEGLDGSRVLAHMPPADTYNGQAFPEEVLRSADKNKDAGIINHAVMLVGHGDGGGGASPAMVESITRMNDVDGVPKVEFSTPARFFREAKKLEHALPRWVGELYFELHRGTYTTQAMTKKYNRTCETMLRDLEMLCSQALVLGASVGQSFEYPSTLLQDCWKLVLKNCFHDTLPGSCIGEVYKETGRDYEYVVHECAKAIETCLSFIGQCVTISSNGTLPEVKRLKTENGHASVSSSDVNGAEQAGEEVLLISRCVGSPDEVTRPYVLETDLPKDALSQDVYYQPIGETGLASKLSSKGKANTSKSSLIALHARPSGFGVLSRTSMVQKSELQDKVIAASVSVENADGKKEYVLSNGLVQARISATGRLTSLVLHSETGVTREALSTKADPGDPGSQGGNRFVIYDDIPQFWCGWDTEVYAFEKWKEVGAATSCEVVESGPLRVGVHIKYPPTSAGSTIQQFVSLRAGSARLDFHTEVDWKESRKILRVLFNTQVRAPEASYDSQFGFVKRPTTFNHSWEVAKFESVGHHYCDISEHKFGVAVLNDCKYGYSVRDSTMRLSLLRASKSPDDNADIGTHTMTYSILPHWGSFPTRVVLNEGQDVNWPPVLHKSEAMSIGEDGLESVDCSFRVVTDTSKGELDSVVISAVKQADKKPGHLVVRMYEAMGARGLARLACPERMQMKNVFECNMLEDVEPDRKTDIVANHSTSGTCELMIPFNPFQVRTLMLQYE